MMDFLNVGTRVVLQGAEPVTGEIVDFIKGDDGNIAAYQIKVDNGGFLICALDDPLKPLDE
ncbi:hypothetical protein ACFLTO_01595 [Chloroflexota bacterium]